MDISDADLAWAAGFVRDEILPLETIEYDVTDEKWRELTGPLKEVVKRRGLWAAHLSPALGGQGAGQVALCQLNEVIGRSAVAPPIFGNNAPDSGNAELIALAATPEQRERWLVPLLAGSLRSGFSMTEPEVSGSDPTLLRTRADLVDGRWVINGHKWFTSQGSAADFLLVVARTEPDAPPHQSYSILLVPVATPGVRVIRDVPTMHSPYARLGKREPMGHSEVVYRDVIVPAGHLLGERGAGFKLAQQRLGPGRLHHAMRWIGQASRAFDMMCERALSRVTHGRALAEHQMVADFIALSAIEIRAARLMCLDAARALDEGGSLAARDQIAEVKVFGASMLYNVLDRAIQVHGALGYSADLPLEEMYRRARAARLVDGADEVHKASIAKRALRRYTAAGDHPTEYVPARRTAALAKYGLPGS